MGKKSLNKPTSSQRTTAKKDYNSFKVVLFYCLLIIILPVITFFTVKNAICDSLLNMNPISSNISSAMCAVIALHVALGIYIYRAYFAAEDSADDQADVDKKQD